MFTKNNEGIFDLPGKLNPGYPDLGAGGGNYGGSSSSNSYSLQNV